MENTFESIVAVSGLSGLYRVAANRHNGLIIEDLDNGSRKFAPSRSHQFTLLASIGIYTYTDTEDLSSVFQRIKDAKVEMPATDVSDQEIREYFREILPDHDEDRVRLSDIRKVIKWYQVLESHKLLPEATEAVTEAPVTAAPENEEESVDEVAAPSTKKSKVKE